MSETKPRNNDPVKHPGHDTLHEGGDKTMTICPVKRFTPELIRIYEKRMLKRLVYGPFGDLRRLEKNPDTPACLRLLIGGLFRDCEAARLDTLANILDVLTVKH
jgi:hypothetical protein